MPASIIDLNKREREVVGNKLRKGATYTMIAARWGVAYATARKRCNRNGLYTINGPGAPIGNKNGVGKRTRRDA